MGVRVNGSSTYMGPGIWVCAYGSGHMGLGIWVQSYGSRHMGLPNVQPDFDAPCFIGPGTQDLGPILYVPVPGKRICFHHQIQNITIRFNRAVATETAYIYN